MLQQFLDNLSLPCSWDQEFEQEMMADTILVPPTTPTVVYPEPNASTGASRKLRILMLHGFAQSGPFFQHKTKALTRYLDNTFPRDTMSQFPGGYEFLYPSGPVDLSQDVKSDFTEDQSQTTSNSEINSWWRVLDVTSRYSELQSTLDYLVDYLREVGPVDGVIGFSQGGAMAMMLASLAEAQTNPRRREALAAQGAPIVLDFPQKPFKFAISFAGFRGTWKYYSGFYNPKISTPTMHIVGDLDTVVDAERTSELISACRNPYVIHHQGAHYVPAQSQVLSAVACFINDQFLRMTEPSLANLLCWRATGDYFTVCKGTLAPKEFDVSITALDESQLSPPLSVSSSVSGDSFDSLSTGSTGTGQRSPRPRGLMVCKRARVVRSVSARR